MVCIAAYCELIDHAMKQKREINKQGRFPGTELVGFFQIHFFTVEATVKW